MVSFDIQIGHFFNSILTPLTANGKLNMSCGQQKGFHRFKPFKLQSNHVNNFVISQPIPVLGTNHDMVNLEMNQLMRYKRSSHSIQTFYLELNFNFFNFEVIKLNIQNSPVSIIDSIKCNFRFKHDFPHDSYDMHMLCSTFYSQYDGTSMQGRILLNKICCGKLLEESVAAGLFDACC